ncbi:MAG: hypothetical protein NUV75_04985, partial [Gallionella sp.]|nr:hypothetical protein [Gallionella sp.]
RAGLLAMNAGKPLAHLTDTTRPVFARMLASRYLDGEDIASLAVEYDVTRDRLYQILVEGDSDAWRSAQSAKALTAFQDTKEQLESAPDGLSLARARELHKSAQWQLEKLLRRLYGDDKTAINVNAAGQVSIQIVSYSGQDQPVIAPQQVQRSMDSDAIDGEKA